jgi:hypothetical protein
MPQRSVSETIDCCVGLVCRLCYINNIRVVSLVPLEQSNIGQRSKQSRSVECSHRKSRKPGMKNDELDF